MIFQNIVMLIPKIYHPKYGMGKMQNVRILKKNSMTNNEQMEQVKKYVDYNTQIMNLTFNEESDFIDKLYQNRAEATVGIGQLLNDSLTALEDVTDRKKYHGLKNPGVLAVEMGYDVIKAEGHGNSGSYSVILNRTKVIFCKGGFNLWKLIYIHQKRYIEC